MIKAGIIGASGYTGGELLRLLVNHPDIRLELATSRSLAGKPVTSTHRHLEGFLDLKYENPDPEEIRERCDVVFVAVPHGTAMNYVPELLDGSTKVIDLSADYRLDIPVFEKIYGMEHKDPRKTVYGLVELHPEAAKEELVANPGCFPTGATLAAAPLAAAGLIDIAVFDSKTGISGAGISPTGTSHYPNLAENIIPYKLTAHRHRAEIFQELTRLDGKLRNISFTPHVIPSVRGIFTTAHLFTKEPLSTEDVQGIYEEFYRSKPFVRLPGGVPSLTAVRGSNFCDIGFEADKENNRVVVLSAIDNLVKGASGQAIQNMNLMFGLAETRGLWLPAAAP
ncbi:N-acetyl-gamma-glutamyl-phosphate reductase [Methanosarcina sp. 2.H.T.1A.6]|uniref:N-acetyl-gamma-glutamyl-phosphate reductase n=1 Tax=unclassified Methanosarcina TaxID=2644672 RepID=UPI0006219D04|nr:MULTISPECIES: N-acetyl-gamma-glutamyl-phosphate reductase [unclassified Methanosarcina]KKG11758.1 N-acetyl-gamma-glutamyl-phosphate reductase [Methanosarcina sp. 2.H.T.1A.15]KKG17652.1 N-acetyl-gamma-glutamyl-phosphate reductase [Methanosarcina sp. 2.H.T.1A.3]KKG21892.1 N-acetyl-gamma-glutamyl-phosphate reductase [Methanosarcina sp. 2.H.T.1A.6]KKG25428.1 N-acetyl-gamma-glutamyl-phosphate reductase [Methanosarcina sp. 2.H.T.1A.8]